MNARLSMALVGAVSSDERADGIELTTPHICPYYMRDLPS